MSKNSNLHSAKKGKNDEFYTQLSDIENEMRHYWPHFQDKIIYCNCDDPAISNFYKYFSMQFNNLQLRKLMTSCYRNQSANLFSLHDRKRAIWLEYDGDNDQDNMPVAPRINHFWGDGDFRNDENIELLKQADIVVTNPPFSLFREYVAQLMEYDRKFIIMGNMNASNYKEIFPFIRENKLWYGPSISSGGRWFGVPDDYPLTATSCKQDEYGNNYVSVKGVRWFTNLHHYKRNEKLLLWRKYDPADYPKYDNYDAINVDKTKDIPVDYDGVMGVPITFLDKYNPNQFELLGIMNTGEENLGIRYSNTPHGRPVINGIEKYIRILIKRK